MDNKPVALGDEHAAKLVAASNAAANPAELREQIAETRNEMTGTIEELHGRLNPVVFKDQALDQFHEVTETVKVELKERMQDAKDLLLTELKDVKQTVRADLNEEIESVKARVNNEIVQAKAALREATIGKVENMMHSTQDRVRSASRSIKEVVSDNPIPAAITGVGLLWLFLEGRRNRRTSESWIETRDAYRGDDGWDTSGRVRERAGQTGRRVADATREAASRVQRVAGDAKESVVEVAERVQERAGELTRDVEEQGRRVQRRTGELYRDNPIAIGAAVLATGTMVGLAIPSTEIENEWMGSARDDVIGKAQDLAHQTLEKAGEKVKNLGSQGTENGGQEPSKKQEPPKSRDQFH